MKQYDLGWGESVVVRQRFLEHIRCRPIQFDYKSMETEMGYPKHEGDPALIELTKKVIKRQYGREYKHVLITNGATGGVTIALRTYAQTRGKYQCWLDDPPYFSVYPSMVRAAGMTICHNGLDKDEETYHPLKLIHSPKNPENTFDETKKLDWSNYSTPIVWDGVYYNNVYTPGNCPQPDHDVLVGSYSKLTGMNGIRLGWIATDDTLLYEHMKNYVTAEYCGMSSASTKIIMETVGQFNDTVWDLFETTARYWLDLNREEWSKLEKYFGNKPVDPIGMFYYSTFDSSCKKLLEKSGVIWTTGSSLGTNDDFGRINLGQDAKLIKSAVKAILKNDKI